MYACMHACMCIYTYIIHVIDTSVFTSTTSYSYRAPIPTSGASHGISVDAGDGFQGMRSTKCLGASDDARRWGKMLLDVMGLYGILWDYIGLPVGLLVSMSQAKTSFGIFLGYFWILEIFHLQIWLLWWCDVKPIPKKGHQSQPLLPCWMGTWISDDLWMELATLEDVYAHENWQFFFGIGWTS